VDPRVALDDVEKRKFLTLPGLELRSIGRPARSQSLNRLLYPGPYLKENTNYNKFSEIIFKYLYYSRMFFFINYKELWYYVIIL
jgi:hypothetical protein